MHTQLFVTIMIAALMWAGVPSVTVAPTTHRAQEVSNTAIVPTETPEEQAKAMALAHAGLTVDEVQELRVEPDRDDGRPEYEVEFRCGDWEYDYTIHAETMEILKHDKEYDPPKAPMPDKPKETVPVETIPPETTPAKREQISAEKAKSIALTHAGLTASEVNGLRVELDRDDGRLEYEVEFRVGKWEYSYEIHGGTGKILDWEKEYDD